MTPRHRLVQSNTDPQSIPKYSWARESHGSNSAGKPTVSLFSLNAATVADSEGIGRYCCIAGGLRLLQFHRAAKVGLDCWFQLGLARQRLHRKG